MNVWSYSLQWLQAEKQGTRENSQISTTSSCPSTQYFTPQIIPDLSCHMSPLHPELKQPHMKVKGNWKKLDNLTQHECIICDSLSRFRVRGTYTWHDISFILDSLLIPKRSFYLCSACAGLVRYCYCVCSVFSISQFCLIGVNKYC